MAPTPKSAPFWLSPLFAGISLLGAASGAYLNASYAKVSDLSTYAKYTEVTTLVRTTAELQARQAATAEKVDGTAKQVDALQGTLQRMDTKIDDIRNYLLTQKGR